MIRFWLYFALYLSDVEAFACTLSRLACVLDAEQSI
jgi:hypothetical protein